MTNGIIHFPALMNLEKIFKKPLDKYKNIYYNADS